MASSPTYPSNPARFLLLTLACCRQDALFIPSWWWHAVDTTPEPAQDPEEEGQAGVGVGAWSAALNLWFEPFYVKSYGCAVCERRAIPLYAGLDRPP